MIGGGGAGLTAAVSAAQQGASVAVLEKTGSLGGNTIRATAMSNCVDDALQRPLNIADSEQLFFEETYNGGHQKAKPELVRILTSQADEGLAFLQELGLQIDTVIDNCLGGEHARGHYSKAHNGTDFIQVLGDACAREGVDLYLNTKAEALLQDDSGAIIGVTAAHERQTIQFEARRGVILATGGFGYNVEMRMHYDQSLTGDLLCSNAPGTLGEDSSWRRPLVLPYEYGIISSCIRWPIFMTEDCTIPFPTRSTTAFRQHAGRPLYPRRRRPRRAGRSDPQPGTWFCVFDRRR